MSRPDPAGIAAGAGQEGKRRPGKQPGAPGSHLAWGGHPYDTVAHFPRGACGCGRDLAGAADLGVVASHQEVDVPLASARVIQHDLHEVACACGAVRRAPAPPGRGRAGDGHLRRGPAGLVVFLIAARHVLVHRCAELIESLTGARPSPGFVHALIARAARKQASLVVTSLLPRLT